MKLSDSQFDHRTLFIFPPLLCVFPHTLVLFLPLVRSIIFLPPSRNIRACELRLRHPYKSKSFSIVFLTPLPLPSDVCASFILWLPLSFCPYLSSVRFELRNSSKCFFFHSADTPRLFSTDCSFESFFSFQGNLRVPTGSWFKRR